MIQEDRIEAFFRIRRPNNLINNIRVLVDQWLFLQHYWTRTRYRERCLVLIEG